jgi:anti-sigma factor RsiW
VSACLGEQVAALVDGELDHAARERAQRHLAHCTPCRAEVDAHRRLKSRLHDLSSAEPALPDALTARLLALTPPGDSRLPSPPPRGTVRPVSLRAAPGPAASRPAGRRPGLRRRTAVGSALAVLGAALALGGPQSAATAPVDPATDSFVVQHVGTTAEVPRVLEASVTGGGAGAPR